MGLLRATRYVASLPQVSVDELVGAGVRLVLLDRAREAGLRLCLVSNNFHSSQVRASAAQMGVEAVDHAMKPLPFALVRAMRLMGAVPGETVMIGDQVFTDVCAGSLAGVRTILVRPQSRRDLWYTHVFRVFERLALHGVEFDGE